MAIQYEHARIEHAAALVWTHCEAPSVSVGLFDPGNPSNENDSAPFSADAIANAAAHAEIHASGSLYSISS
jgi:hypothetical protein